ncbi:hypothetical protein [Xanthomonas graminis]|uniref:hypothetical protein n=1 Tax=Xanthomonas graminis TaxID=3390026 RepID=UPI00253FB080|nr:hypothetical protein [Xanthomonas translucens]
MTLQSAAPDGERSRGEIGGAFAETGSIFAAALAIRALAALAPCVVLWWLVAWLRRRGRRV